jgi:hypothetical protein
MEKKHPGTVRARAGTVKCLQENLATRRFIRTDPSILRKVLAAGSLVYGIEDV